MIQLASHISIYNLYIYIYKLCDMHILLWKVVNNAQHRYGSGCVWVDRRDHESFDYKLQTIYSPVCDVWCIYIYNFPLLSCNITWSACITLYTLIGLVLHNTSMYIRSAVANIRDDHPATKTYYIVSRYATKKKKR